MAFTCSLCSYLTFPSIFHPRHIPHQHRSFLGKKIGHCPRLSAVDGNVSMRPQAFQIVCHLNGCKDGDANTSGYKLSFSFEDYGISCWTYNNGAIRLGKSYFGACSDSHVCASNHPCFVAVGESSFSGNRCNKVDEPGRAISTRAVAGADLTTDDSLTDLGTRRIATLNFQDSETLPTIPASKRVVLVRHGQSTWNAEGRIQGSSDFAILTAKGEIQAETSRQMLLSDYFDVCFHSPLARATHTAEIIWGPRTNPIIAIHDLREIDLYGFQGLMKNEGKARYGDAYRTWQIDAANFLIDGHYPVRELWARAKKCWDEILGHEGQSILVVAHNAVNQALVATATGLGPKYFRQLLQSNCGVSVLDFAPRSSGDGPPYVCLDRLNQTPSPPVVGDQSAGRKAGCHIILICHGATESSVENRFPLCRSEVLNMLGIIQARKTAELLLDVRVNLVLSSQQPSAKETAEAIIEVQEAADCLGADCVPRYVEEKELPELQDLDWGQWKGRTPVEIVGKDRWQDVLLSEDAKGGESVTAFWERAGGAWQAVLEHVKRVEVAPGQASNVVVVGHELTHTAMLGHCLGLTPESIGTFHLDTGSLSVIDLPDGPSGRGVVRCLNYTAHLGRWAVPITLPTLGDEDF